MLERKVIVLGETFAELPMKIKATCTGTKYFKCFNNLTKPQKKYGLCDTCIIRYRYLLQPKYTGKFPEQSFWQRKQYFAVITIYLLDPPSNEIFEIFLQSKSRYSLEAQGFKGPNTAGLFLGFSCRFGGNLSDCVSYF